MSTTCAGAFRRRPVAWSPRSWRTARAPRFFRRADSLHVRSAPALEKPGSSTARMIAQQAMTLPYPSPSRVDYRVYLSRVKRVGPGVTTEQRRSYRSSVQRTGVTSPVLPASVWVEVKAAAVEVDRRLEVLPVAEAAGGVPDPLDLRVRAFGRRVGDPVAQVGEDVRQVRLEHPRLLDHGLEPRVGRPEVR